MSKVHKLQWKDFATCTLTAQRFLKICLLSSVSYYTICPYVEFMRLLNS